MEEYILRSKKEANGRKRLPRHKRTRKTEKQRYPLPPPFSPLLLYAAAKTPKNGYKGRGPERSTTKPLHGTNHPSLHHPSPIAPPKTFTFSTHFSLYSSAATRTDRRRKKEPQELHHEFQELPQEPQDHKMNMAPRI
jgi:hypothetical protein